MLWCQQQRSAESAAPGLRCDGPRYLPPMQHSPPSHSGFAQRRRRHALGRSSRLRGGRPARVAVDRTGRAGGDDSCDCSPTCAANSSARRPSGAVDLGGGSRSGLRPRRGVRAGEAPRGAGTAPLDRATGAESERSLGREREVAGGDPRGRAFAVLARAPVSRRKTWTEGVAHRIVIPCES